SIQGVHLFPVRHHSPRSASCLRAWLQTVRPELILIEGPSDAEALIPIITDPDSQPPIAILAYSTDGKPQSCMWPFVRYSPEYEALRWAREHGVKARFVDWPSGAALGAARQTAREAESHPEVPATSPTPEESSDPDASADRGNRQQELAERFGLRHFNEFWDAWFETPA